MAGRPYVSQNDLDSLNLACETPSPEELMEIIQEAIESEGLSQGLTLIEYYELIGM